VGAKTLLIVPEWRGQGLRRDLDARAEEAAGLARAIALDIRAVHPLRLRQTRAATLLGTGQIEALAPAIKGQGIELVVVDAALTAIQQRNLETAFSAKVIDRTGLILEIFGERAATAEGRLQVELAHLDYQAGRLVRSWTHLERQRGGFGFLGGPGETQIEADRRMIRDRMARIRKQLEEARRTRGLQRGRRQKAPWPVVALVGYTNAGKSTLFNRLTQGDVMAADMLFATLDPTMREIRLPEIDKAILSDTVGFVSDLPTELVAAFRATLEEVTTADLIAHVRDMSHPDSEAQQADVEAILTDLGVMGLRDGDDAPTPRIEIWNKLDACDGDRRADLQARAAARADVVLISALTGEGMDAARAKIGAWLTRDFVSRRLTLPIAAGEAAAWLHAHGRVVVEHSGDAGQHLHARLSPRDWHRFTALWPEFAVRPL
jgi:GTP-binding protein HflX